MSTSDAQKLIGEGSSSDIDTGSKTNSDIDVISEKLSANTIADNTNTMTIADVRKMSISDFEELLFRDPPPNEDCSVCMLPLPHHSGVCGVEKLYMESCGKTFCRGCSLVESKEMKKGNIKPWCSFCRAPLSGSDKETVERYKRRTRVDDAEAIYSLCNAYSNGHWGLRQNHLKAIGLWKRGAELGSCNANAYLASIYLHGEGIEEDRKLAMHHMKLAAIGGHETARYALGLMEEQNGNIDRAMKHYMISAKCGFDDSLKEVGEGYNAGLVTKDEYVSTLRAHEECQGRMRSAQREEAAHWKRTRNLGLTDT